jgi:hypothetical protein
MMLQLVTTAKFRKDYKRIKKRDYNLSLLADVIDTLLREEPSGQVSIPKVIRDILGIGPGDRVVLLKLLSATSNWHRRILT